MQGATFIRTISPWLVYQEIESDLWGFIVGRVVQTLTTD